MFGRPGKKLLFMGCEFAQESEWNDERSLDWHLTANPAHHGMQRLVRDLNRLYRETPALYRRDFDPSGFEWVDYQDADNSVLSSSAVERKTMHRCSSSATSRRRCTRAIGSASPHAEPGANGSTPIRLSTAAATS